MKHIQGNLLDFPENIQIICHCANIRNVMGAGIAKQIKERYPSAYQADTNFEVPCGKDRLGQISYCSLKNGKYIVNLYGQDLGVNSLAGYPLSYDALYSSLNLLQYFCQLNKIKSIGFPKYMGCYRAGGNWDIVSNIIKIIFKDYNIVVVEFK